MRYIVLTAVVGTILAFAATGCVEREVVNRQTPGPVVYVQKPPPAEIVEVQPPPPGPREIWVWQKGHWQWDGSNYHWVQGHWAQRPANVTEWVAPHWESRSGGYLFIEGRWQ